jgi:hypothetical protein
VLLVLVPLLLLPITAVNTRGTMQAEGWQG